MITNISHANKKWWPELPSRGEDSIWHEAVDEISLTLGITQDRSSCKRLLAEPEGANKCKENDELPMVESEQRHCQVLKELIGTTDISAAFSEQATVFIPSLPPVVAGLSITTTLQSLKTWVVEDRKEELKAFIIKTSSTFSSPK